MNALSRREEDTVVKTAKTRALKLCDPVVKEFAECATGRIVSVAWACRKQLHAVEDCMRQYTSPAQLDKVRAEYLRLRNEQNEYHSLQGEIEVHHPA